MSDYRICNDRAIRQETQRSIRIGMNKMKFDLSKFYGVGNKCIFGMTKGVVIRTCRSFACASERP